MRQLTRMPLCLGLLLGTLVFTLPAHAALHDPGVTSTSGMLRDGGDVLRPDRGSGDYHWYLGFDAGLTYSMFQNGPVVYYISNPYLPTEFLLANVDEGSGIGLYFGATLDFPLSEIIGVVVKGNFHSRAGSFEEVMDLGPINDPVIHTIFNNKTDMTYNYIGVDLLARVNLGSAPLYVLLGPSFSFLSSNKVKLDQAIVQPEGYYYKEDIFGNTPNQYTTANSEAEITDFNDSRTDLKFGLGYRLELNPDLLLTPELTAAYPLSDHINRDKVDPLAISSGLVNPDFNMITVFFTLGLRWRIGS